MNVKLICSKFWNIGTSSSLPHGVGSWKQRSFQLENSNEEIKTWLVVLLGGMIFFYPSFNDRIITSPMSSGNPHRLFLLNRMRFWMAFLWVRLKNPLPETFTASEYPWKLCAYPGTVRPYPHRTREVRFMDSKVPKTVDPVSVGDFCDPSQEGIALNAPKGGTQDGWRLLASTGISG